MHVLSTSINWTPNLTCSILQCSGLAQGRLSDMVVAGSEAMMYAVSVRACPILRCSEHRRLRG